ncbi:MAG TPA: DinB family protein [Gemmatimonadales bacterium]|nr:DinB family protein [Gemmatimonadales bacterium]
MLAAAVRTLLVRELRALRRELEAYPDDASVWRQPPGLANSAGTLALHVAGNLQHFVGAVLGDSGYVRDRDAEFARRDVPRAELMAGLDAAIAAVEHTLPSLSEARLDDPYPVPVAGHLVQTGEYLCHLAAHLAYHLGQIDYHRRSVTGDARGVGALAPAELGTARPQPA